MGQQRSRLASAEKVRQLVDSAFASRYHDVTTMLQLSSEAVALAEEKSHELPSDLVAAAWTQYGNALRIATRFEEAERALDRAGAIPISDPSTKTNHLEVTSSLYRNTKRFEEAVSLLVSAADEQRSNGDSVGEARTYNLLGITYLDSGDLQNALFAYKKALNLFISDAQVDALAMTGHNLLEALIADRRLSAAASVLALLEPFYRRVNSARLAAKIEWARARLCRALWQLPAAQIAFERAHTLLITDPKAPEIPLLLKEMADLEALMGRTAGADEDGHGPTGGPNQAPEGRN